MCWAAWLAGAAEGTLAAGLLYERVGAALHLLTGLPRDQAALGWMAANVAGHLTLAIFMGIQQGSEDASGASLGLAATAVQLSVGWKALYAGLHVFRQRVSGVAANPLPSEAAREVGVTLTVLVAGPLLTVFFLALSALTLPDARPLGRIGLWSAVVGIPACYAAYLSPLGRLGRNWQAIRPWSLSPKHTAATQPPASAAAAAAAMMPELPGNAVPMPMGGGGAH